MGDKEFKEQLPDLSLNPDYRVEETTTDLSEDQEIDVKALMAEYEEMMVGGEDFEDIEPQPSLEDILPDSESDERQTIREMISTMRELTEEVKLLRAQIETKPNDVYVYPKERTLAIPTDVLDTVDEQPDITDEQPDITDEQPDITDEQPDTQPDTQSSEQPSTQPDIQLSTQPDSAPEEKKKKNKGLSIMSSVLFYVVVVAMVFGAFLIKSNSGGRPTMIAGYSAFTVLTSSMQDVYPQGSLIVTKSVDAKDLKVGDDITYMVSETSSITHRIIGITENFQGTGERGFETKGVMNPNPDKELVAATNVVGRVIFHSKVLGDMAAFVSQNWPFLLFLIIVLIGLISFLKWNAKHSDDDTEETPKKQEKLTPKERRKRWQEANEKRPRRS